MKQSGFRSLLLGLIAILPIRQAMSAETNDQPHFQEILRLLRANLPNVSDDDLNRAAAEGLLNAFYPRVMLVTNEPAVNVPPEKSLVSKATVYDDSYGYLRVARVVPGLTEQIKTACNNLGSANKLKGLVLDLRFADGNDYEAAARAADLFLAKEQPLLKWDEGAANATSKTDAIAIPVTVLVNQQTAGAAEALAAVLRETDAAVLVGSRTAGQALVFKVFTLDNGQRLRIATGQVEIGKGQSLSATGIAPDIYVKVDPNDEKAYFADAFKVLPKPIAQVKPTIDLFGRGSTNRNSPQRLNEAELVRMQRAGISPDDAESALSEFAPPDVPLAHVVHDPALARALDLLKGIAIVQHSVTR